MKVKLLHNEENGCTRIFLDDMEIKRVSEYSICQGGGTPAIRLAIDVDSIEHFLLSRHDFTKTKKSLKGGGANESYDRR